MFSKQSQGLKKRRVVCALSLAAPPILTTLQLVVPGPAQCVGVLPFCRSMS